MHQIIYTDSGMLVDFFLKRAFNRFVLGRNVLGNGSSTFLRRSCERVAMLS
jgi:hypothetical protein